MPRPVGKARGGSIPAVFDPCKAWSSVGLYGMDRRSKWEPILARALRSNTDHGDLPTDPACHSRTQPLSDSMSGSTSPVCSRPGQRRSGPAAAARLTSTTSAANRIAPYRAVTGWRSPARTAENSTSWCGPSRSSTSPRRRPEGSMTTSHRHRPPPSSSSAGSAAGRAAPDDGDGDGPRSTQPRTRANAANCESLRGAKPARGTPLRC